MSNTEIDIKLYGTKIILGKKDNSVIINYWKTFEKALSNNFFYNKNIENLIIKN